ncbi:hypothetical protein MKUB_53120 [Mycobacterium kubicae]|uniref:Uncharacterized protein n=1 Tax=Mycobacterium kubicae TaxID=120959 RepID=A0ABQ1BVQ1_9MYCO|nr:hypothetical protein MKUB_53120 [Mycobacterium kubicae]
MFDWSARKPTCPTVSRYGDTMQVTTFGKIPAGIRGVASLLGEGAKKRPIPWPASPLAFRSEAARGTPERLALIARHYLDVAALTDEEVLAEG